MLLERRRSFLSVLHEANHCFIAMLVKSIKIMIFNLSEVINVLFVSRLLGNWPGLTFVVWVTARHKGVLEVSNESNSWFKFHNERLLKGDVPSSFDSPWRFSIEWAIFTVSWALYCKNVMFISYLDFPDVFFINVELVIVSDQLDFVWQLMPANLFRIIKVHRIWVWRGMECPNLSDVIDVSSALRAFDRLICHDWRS